MNDDEFFKKLVEYQLTVNENYPTCAFSINDLYENRNIAWVNLDGSWTVDWQAVREEAQRQVKLIDCYFNDNVTVAHLKAFQRKALCTILLAAKDNFKEVDVETSNDVNLQIIENWYNKKLDRANFTP